MPRMQMVAGAGVTLEPQLASHAAELFAIIAEPAVYRYIDQAPPASEEVLRARLLRLESRVSPDGAAEWLNWVVRLPDRRIAGYVQATVTPDHAAEIAYVLGRDFWRRGIGEAACRAMIGQLRAHHGVTRLTATLDSRNGASLALLRKLGLGPAWEDRAANAAGYAAEIADMPQ